MVRAHLLLELSSTARAASLLMQKVRAGDRRPDVLARHLDDAYGRPTKYGVLHASLLPRFAIQGLPR
jgi:hypothetical protein